MVSAEDPEQAGETSKEGVQPATKMWWWKEGKLSTIFTQFIMGKTKLHLRIEYQTTPAGSCEKCWAGSLAGTGRVSNFQVPASSICSSHGTLCHLLHLQGARQGRRNLCAAAGVSSWAGLPSQLLPTAPNWNGLNPSWCRHGGPRAAPDLHLLLAARSSCAGKQAQQHTNSSFQPAGKTRNGGGKLGTEGTCTLLSQTGPCSVHQKWFSGSPCAQINWGKKWKGRKGQAGRQAGGAGSRVGGKWCGWQAPGEQWAGVRLPVPHAAFFPTTFPLPLLPSPLLLSTTYPPAPAFLTTFFPYPPPLLSPLLAPMLLLPVTGVGGDKFKMILH